MKSDVASRASILPVALAAIGLPLLFAASLALGTSTTDLTRYGAIDLSLTRTALVWGIAAAEGGLLWLVYGALRRGAGPWALALLSASAAVMLASAVCYPVTTTADPLAYLGYAKLPTFADAYHPPVFDFGRQFGAIRFWGNPMVACVYGPLWLALDRALLHGVQSVSEALLLLRLQNVVAFAVVVGALAAAGFELPLVALVALNPAPIFSFIVSAHNDIVALALIALAFAFVHRRAPWLAVVCAAAAGAVKIVFVGIAVTAFLPLEGRGRRIALAAAAVALAVAVSAVFGGIPYLHAIMGVSGHVNSFAVRHRLYVLGLAVHAACAAIAVAALAWGLWSGRTFWSATWSFWTLAAAWFEWYVAWCLPYALRARRYAPVFLAAWPLAAVMLFHPPPHYNPMVLVVALVAVDFVSRGMLREARRPATEGPPAVHAWFRWQ